MVQNQILKLQHQDHVTTWVQWNLKDADSIEQLRLRLGRHQIRVALQKDKQGLCRDVTYIDMQNKCIYSGDELGERCNHLAIQKIIDRETTQKLEQSQNQTYRLRHHF